jgi:hypothetical protein
MPIWLNEHGQRVPTRPCPIPDLRLTEADVPHRFEHLVIIRLG